MSYTKHCLLCGAEMQDVGANRVYCDACNKERKRVNELAKKYANPKNGAASISKIVALAAEKHLSYGQYLAKYGEPPRSKKGGKKCK